MEEPRESFNELMDTPLDFSAFVMNRLKVDTLTPELLTGPTFELMKGSCKSLVELEYLFEEGRKRQQFYGFAANRESARDVYSKRKIIAVTKLEIVDKYNYKHLDWITVHEDDDKLYKFKEDDFNRLRIQDIEDMLLHLVQCKLTNLTVEERLAFNVSLRMFTRSVVIQRRVEDLQLGVESYQKKLNLTKLNTEFGTEYQPQDYLEDKVTKKKAGADDQAIEKQAKRPGDYEEFGEKFVDKMDSMHSTLSMYYDYGAHVKGELLVMMKNFQSVNLLIFISNTLIEIFNDFGFDWDGIPKRLTMYLNLWSYKVVRHMYSNPMIQPELEGSTQGYPLDSVEVLRYDTKGEKVRIGNNDDLDGANTRINPTRYYTLAGNPIKEILLKLNLPDHRILKDGGEGTWFQLTHRFIATCSYPTDKHKDIMKAQVQVSRLPLL
ncbi:hypothetical protein Tco_0231763 [Tanacetum coccineum]